jgi:hypothetical protein
MPLAFTLPLGIIIAAIAAGAAVLYFLNERRHVTRDFIVPYVKFCERMRRPINNPRGLPRWWILFLLQILALIFLVGGISQCHPRSSTLFGREIAVILDCSRSMKAADGQTTRFEKARAKALSLLSNEDTTVIAATGNPMHLPKATARESLQNLMPSDTGADIERALDMAQAALASPAGHIHLLTDRGRAVYERWHRKYGENHPPVTIHTFGEDVDNVAIVRFELYQSLFAGGYDEIEAYLTIQNFGEREISTHYRILQEGAEIAVGRCVLEPMAQETFTTKGFDRPGRVTAELDFNDALLDDNRAYGLIRPIRPLRYLVISESEALQQALNTEFSAIRFDHKFFDEITDTSAVQSYDGVILDVAPAEMEGFEFPAALWNGGYLASFQQEVYYWVADWDETDELMRYLENFNLPKIHVAGQMPKAEWVQPIIEGRVGTAERVVSLELFPVVSAGEKAGRHAIYFGFDLAAYPLGKYQHLKVLLLNGLKWLHPYSRMAASVETGSPYFLTALESPSPLILTKPDGKTTTFPAGNRVIPGTSLSETGYYQLRSRNDEHGFVANLFNAPDEFDLSADSERTWTSKGQFVSVKARQSTMDSSYIHKAWNLVLLLLIVEVILFAFFSYRESRLGLSARRR